MEKKGISRREFLKNAGKVAGGAAVGGLLSSCATTGSGGSGSGVPSRWDMEADVVILGLGGAGASAAIEAHDAGASVLVLEKQAANHHFSNSRMSGGVWHNPDLSGDPEALVEYVKATMSGENIPWKFEGEMEDRSDAMARMFAPEMKKTEAWLLKIDPDLDQRGMAAGGDASFPMFPKFREAKYGRTVSTRYKGYADANPNQPTYERPKLHKSSGEALMHAIIEEGIKKQRPNIRIEYETPFKRFIRPVVNGSLQGDIQGVTAIQNGREINVKAKRAVIVSTGGFEYNVKMRRAFQEGPGVKGWCFYGSPDNTGDGIEAAILIGAALVKVAKSASRIESAFPYGKAWDEKKLKVGAGTAATSQPNSVIVDNYGARYTDEHIITDSTRPYRYQFYKEAVKYDMLKMMYPRIPSWLIFDETRRTGGAVVGNGTTVAYGFLPWAADNTDAINKGWIIKADTLDELAAKIKADPENRQLIDAATLKTAVARYNSFCAAGADADFNRTPATMGPVERPPFYAMKMYPGGPNTKGGIDADERRQVYDWEGNPIPRLYSAGEISSVFKFTYQAGGNITECMVCGRVAGRNAAAERPWA
ncbi:MAG: FAD-binding protein [Spirochaetaceae bacterium]|nr:FAD-binding protein [Spirochaetaceae bacterium]